MKTLTVTEVARNFSAVIDRAEHNQDDSMTRFTVEVPGYDRYA